MYLLIYREHSTDLKNIEMDVKTQLIQNQTICECKRAHEYNYNYMQRVDCLQMDKSIGQEYLWVKDSR